MKFDVGLLIGELGVASTPTLRFRVTGAANNDITWHILVQYGYVGS